MRTILILASSALISAAAFTGPTMADEPLHLTPPLYRDQVHALQQGQRLTHPTTTPQPVFTADNPRTASTTERFLIQASAEARR